MGADRAATATVSSVMAGLRVFAVVASRLVADCLRHGLAGDVLPGVFEGWHAELAGEPGQVVWPGPGRRVGELVEHGHAPDGPVQGLGGLLPGLGGQARAKVRGKNHDGGRGRRVYWVDHG